MADTVFAVQFVETPLFTAQILALATDDEYQALQEQLVKQPDAGDLVRGGGGIRKIRMARPGSGKRGGARVIYFWQKHRAMIYMLVAYAKPAKVDLSPAEVATLRDLIKAL
jgi:hypothetical protein